MTPKPTSTQLRSLYRSFLRELPPRPLHTPSPIQLRIRTGFTSPKSSSSSITSSSSHPSSAPLRQQQQQQREQYQQAKQYLLYIRSQRMYATLLERYNPGLGMEMDEEERVRLSARRVGMNLPSRMPAVGGRGGERTGEE